MGDERIAKQLFFVGCPTERWMDLLDMPRDHWKQTGLSPIARRKKNKSDDYLE